MAKIKQTLAALQSPASTSTTTVPAPQMEAIVPSSPSTNATTSSTTATNSAATTSTNAPPTQPKHELRRHTVEPSPAILQQLSLPTESTTALVISISYAPLTHTDKMSRRIYFPDHQTRPVDTCIEIGKQLQRPEGLHITPPLIPSFILRQSLDRVSRDQLMSTLNPSDQKHQYLLRIQNSEDSGDQVNLLAHSFPPAECVANWSQILIPSTTQAFKPNGKPDGRSVQFQLGFAHPFILQAAHDTLNAHAQMTADLRGQARPPSPSPSIASTVMPMEQEDQPESPSPNYHRGGANSNNSNSSSSSAARKSSLPSGAILSTYTLSPCRLHYVSVQVSNWPRSHPTELCGGDELLHSFLRQHAPDLRLLTQQEYGSTSSSTTIICQRKHLHLLDALQGKVSPAHGIHHPLRLNCEVRMLGAQTCTWCWMPGHGAARCAHRNTAQAPIAPITHQPACRHCYSFEHHTAACRVRIESIKCNLCLTLGHCTADCQHFKPGKRALKDFLAPARQSSHPRRSAPSSAGPILSQAQLSSSNAWQSVQPTAATAPANTSAAKARGPVTTVHQPPLAHSSTQPQYITLDMLKEFMTPFLQQLTAIAARLPPHPTAVANSLSSSPRQPAIDMPA